MFGWFRRPPLTGAPLGRRQKSYSARSGYVYQYYYEGHRPAKRGRQPATEYVFTVSADRKTSFPASVLVSEPAVRSWEQAHGRALTPTERYAIAKMALFQAFDERPAPAHLREEIQVRPADVDGILEILGLT